jgi:hypothetical protein
MKQLLMRRKIVVVSLVVLLAALAVGPVLAGGWAVITLDELPGEIHAGENVHLSFMVRQHGKTPVHFFGGPESPLEPVISGTNVKTGETINITAVIDKSEVGRFYADVVFPSSGEWSWKITPNPLAGTTEFAPLVILPEVAVPATSLDTTASSTAVEAAAPAVQAANTFDVSLILRGAAVLLLVGGVVTAFLAGRRKQPQAAVVDVGD